MQTIVKKGGAGGSHSAAVQLPANRFSFHSFALEAALIGRARIVFFVDFMVFLFR